MEGFQPTRSASSPSSLPGGAHLLAQDGWLIGKIGHVRSFVLFATLSALSVLAQSVWLDPWFWGVLRFIGGFAMGGIYIVIESWFCS